MCTFIRGTRWNFQENMASWCHLPSREMVNHRWALNLLVAWSWAFQLPELSRKKKKSVACKLPIRVTEFCTEWSERLLWQAILLIPVHTQKHQQIIWLCSTMKCRHGIPTPSQIPYIVIFKTSHMLETTVFFFIIHFWIFYTFRYSDLVLFWRLC